MVKRGEFIFLLLVSTVLMLGFVVAQDTITEPTPEPKPELDTTGTGAVITGNAFLDYYYR